MKIVHIIPSLNSGGAETMLYKLLKNKASTNIDVEVIIFLSGGFYSEKIREMHIPIHELDIKKEKNFLKTIFRLFKVLRSADIIQSWMYHSDLIAIIFGKLLLGKKVIWGIRRSYLDKEYMKKSTYYIAKTCAYFSKYVDGIISCTIIGKRNHEEFGYKNQNFVVISNGFDLEEFAKEKHVNLRSSKQLRLLNVARWEPLKDHRTLFAAARILKEKDVKFELQLVGKGLNKNNSNLMEMIVKHNLEKEIKLLGVQKDIPQLMQSADIFISSSFSEGFPNVIGEAMASELYCVATEAGDTKYIIGDFGTTVPTSTPIKLAEGILNAINMDSNDLKYINSQARKRIEEEYSIQSIVQQYESMYQKIYIG